MLKNKIQSFLFYVYLKFFVKKFKKITFCANFGSRPDTPRVSETKLKKNLSLVNFSDKTKHKWYLVYIKKKVT